MNTLLNDMHTGWDPRDNDIREGIATLHTNGEGFWTSVSKAVRITELEPWAYAFVEEDENVDTIEYGELKVYFNTDDWRPDLNGLIYTDPLFVNELREFLSQQGYDSSDIDYSEQGMQGDNFVHLDAGPLFLKSYYQKHPEKF